MTQPTLADIAAITDPLERVRVIARLLAEKQGLSVELHAMRRKAIAECRQTGMRLEDIAEKLNITPGRVSQLAKAGAKAPLPPSRTVPRVLVQRALPTEPAVRGSKSLFLAEAEQQGIRPERRMLYIGLEPAADHVAACLGVDPGSDVVARRKLMLANDVPVRIATSYFRADLFAGTRMAEPEFVLPTLQAALKDLGHRFGHAEETLTARQPTRFENETLDLEPAEWVVQIIRVSYSDGGTPIHALETICAATRHVFMVGQIAGKDEF